MEIFLPALLWCQVMLQALFKFIVLFFLFPALLFGANPGFKFSADEVSFSQKGEDRSISLSGHVVLDLKGITLKSDQATVLGASQRVVQASGGVQLTFTDEAMQFVTGTLIWSRGQEQLVMPDFTILRLTQQNVVIKGQSARFNQQSGLLTFEAGVSFFSPLLLAQSDRLVFNARSQSLTLTGSPTVTSRGSTLSAGRIVIDVKKQSFQLFQDVNGTLDSGRFS